MRKVLYLHLPKQHKACVEIFLFRMSFPKHLKNPMLCRKYQILILKGVTFSIDT